MVSSAPAILRPQVRIPSTPAMFFNFIIQIVMRKRTKINEKEAGIGPIKNILLLLFRTIGKNMFQVMALFIWANLGSKNKEGINRCRRWEVGYGTVGRAVASTPENCSSNPVIGKFYSLSIALKRQKTKKKRWGMAEYFEKRDILNHLNEIKYENDLKCRTARFTL